MWTPVSTTFSKVLILMSEDSAVIHYRWETQAQRVCFPNVHILIQSHIKNAKHAHA